MRRLIIWLAAACITAASTAGAATAKHGGVMCVLHAQLSAQNETTGSTSTATGHTLIKVWSDGTIEFKTQNLNPNQETFIAGHIHLAPAHVAGAVGGSLFLGPATS